MPTAVNSAASALANRRASVSSPCTTERDHRRPLGERTLQAGHASAFLIDAHPQRHLARQQCRLARHLHHLLGIGDIAREEDHATQVELLGDLPDLLGHDVPVEADDGELTDLTPDVAE